jgi:putative flavoprotein involved in K+ transport
MAGDSWNTVVIGGGQAGLAASRHLRERGVEHVVLERARIAERWRSERWDSLVANGPAWHDRFPDMTFDDVEPHVFPTKDRIVEYFEAYAAEHDAPVRCGVEVSDLFPTDDGGFRLDTSVDRYNARNVIVATGPFQQPLIPAVVPPEAGITQVHSSGYRNPQQLPAGAVMVVGAGSSGTQIADELLRSGRRVFLSVGPHDRPPIRYRGKDFCWWLGVLGMWDARTTAPGMEHVTIAVSGAHGGTTVDFRDFAARGMTLVGRAGPFADGVMHIADDLQRNIAGGDAKYLSILDQADAWVTANNSDLPEEPAARVFAPMPACVAEPLRTVDLHAEGITSIVWATGFALDYSWVHAGTFASNGRPHHDKGVTDVPGLYYLGLPWLSRRASPFIWGVWHDAAYVADHIAARASATG